MRRSAGMGLVALVLLVVGCTNPDRPRVQPDEVALPTPLHSFGASEAATIGAVAGAVAGAGQRLEQTDLPVRPSEPQSLLQTPRVALRADLADAGDGFVLVYQLADADAARAAGKDLADYLGSGFGQTNYPVDTQFSVRRIDDTVVFTWWSRGGSSDPEAAERVFDAVSSVGEEIPVLK